MLLSLLWLFPTLNPQSILGEYANNYTTDHINYALFFIATHSKLTVTHRNLKVTNSNLNVTHINLNVPHSNDNIPFLFTLMQEKNNKTNKKAHRQNSYQYFSIYNSCNIQLFLCQLNICLS